MSAAGGRQGARAPTRRAEGSVASREQRTRSPACGGGRSSRASRQHRCGDRCSRASRRPALVGALCALALGAVAASGCSVTPPPAAADCSDAGADGGSACPADAGCQATAADPCAVHCFTLAFEAVACAGGVAPGATQDLSMYVPVDWQQTGGTKVESDRTSSFDVSTCRYTANAPQCSVTWLFDLRARTCTISAFGTTATGQCAFVCPQPCTLTGP